MARYVGTELRGLHFFHRFRSRISATSPGALVSETGLRTSVFWYSQSYGETVALKKGSDMAQGLQRNVVEEPASREHGDRSRLLVEKVQSLNKMERQVKVVERIEDKINKRFLGGGKPYLQNIRVEKSSANTSLAAILLGTRRNSGDGKGNTTEVQKSQMPSKKGLPHSNSKADQHSSKWANLASLPVKAHDSLKVGQSSAPHSKLDPTKEDDFADLGQPQGTEKMGIASSIQMIGVEKAEKTSASLDTKIDSGEGKHGNSEPQKAQEIQRMGSSSVAASNGYSGNPMPKSAMPESLQYLGNALKENSMSNNARKSSPILRTAFERENIQNTDHPVKMINLDFVKGSNLVSPSTMKPEMDISSSRRAEQNGMPLKSDSLLSSREHFRYTVRVENLPDEISLVRIKEALSRHGVITGSFKKPVKNGIIACYIEFQTDEAKENALADHLVFVDGRAFAVSRLDRPMTTVVRISHVSPETTNSKVLSICEKCGKVDSVKRRDTRLFDVFFKSIELSNMTRILNGLNEVTVNQHRWRAQPAPVLHPEAKETMLQTKIGVDWYNTQVSLLLERMNETVNRYSIGLEDLRELHFMVK
eukprot:c26385_g1_i1 orf=233-2005(+)